MQLPFTRAAQELSLPCLGHPGINNLAEISRVLDIAMNPNSLFLAKTKNANVG